MIKGFRTYDLAVELYEKCEQIRAKRHVKDQLSRASLSVVLNLAEGSGKPTKTETHYELAHRLGGSLYRLIHSR